jgi:type III restriction enzyme
MAIIILKPFQQQAVDSAVAVFDHMRSILDTAGLNEENRATAIYDNGYLLIEAPTGAGKTLLAGNIVERVSIADRVVWFWFAPFKGVVDQSAAFLREQFQGLRLRTMTEDRNPIGTHSGDVFVTTWGLVATRVRDRRSVRQTGEQNESVDDLIVSLREQGFRIGVVVDEAHHGFHGDTQAAVFFRTVLKPEFTILVTATPDDKDLQELKERMQIGTIHKVGVSRADAVGPGPEEGLIKRGIKAIAWRVEEGSDALVDFETTALREGAVLHRFLKAELQHENVSLTPLMLVQVEGTGKPVERAKQKLLGLGFTEDQIATHTAKEPDPDLLSLANDERREVLIFVMAVALGFDAPRAWTLVSMRAAKDEDFGVQLVGRILRVHRRLQGRAVPDALRYGYVLLADIETQSGLDAAGQRINRMRTQYASVSPTTIFINAGNQVMVQSPAANGQMELHPVPPPGAIYTPPPVPITDADGNVDSAAMLLFQTAWAPQEMREELRAALASSPPTVGRFSYPLREDVPRKFKTQDLPEDCDVTEDECAEHFVVEAEKLLEATMARDPVRVQKKTLEIFTHQIQMEFSFAPPSLEEMQRRALRALVGCGMFSAKELRRALASRLYQMLAHRGVDDANNRERLNEFLDKLLSQHPELLRNAQKAALAAKAVISDAEELPGSIESETSLDTSALNIYGAFPIDLNSWEREFAEYLDGDDTGAVLWWHRNPPRKPWSINVLLESGRGFFPDFIVGIKERKRTDGGLLADTKYVIETAQEIPKLLAEHAAYGRVLILKKDASERWRIAGLDSYGRAGLEGLFRIGEAARY